MRRYRTVYSRNKSPVPNIRKKAGGPGQTSTRWGRRIVLSDRSVCWPEQIPLSGPETFSSRATRLRLLLVLAAAVLFLFSALNIFFKSKRSNGPHHFVYKFEGGQVNASKFVASWTWSRQGTLYPLYQHLVAWMVGFCSIRFLAFSSRPTAGPVRLEDRPPVAQEPLRYSWRRQQCAVARQILRVCVMCACV